MPLNRESGARMNETQQHTTYTCVRFVLVLDCRCTADVHMNS